MYTNRMAYQFKGGSRHLLLCFIHEEINEIKCADAEERIRDWILGVKG